MEELKINGRIGKLLGHMVQVATIEIAFLWLLRLRRSQVQLHF